jgi:hypothetical protein
MFLTLLVRLLERLRQRKKFRGPWEAIWFVIVVWLAMIELEFAWFWLPLVGRGCEELDSCALKSRL